MTVAWFDTVGGPIPRRTAEEILNAQTACGQTVPEKWQLVNAATGAPISDPSSFVSFTSYQVSCTTWSGDPASAITELASGSSGLQYLGSGNWQFNWQTSKLWAKSCREAVLTLKDGSQHMAKFNFVK